MLKLRFKFKFWDQGTKEVLTQTPGTEDLNSLINFSESKKLIKNALENAVKLTHAQIHFITKTYGLTIGHYSDFTGKMPSGKIFKLPKFEEATEIKIYHLSEVIDRSSVLDLPTTLFGNNYYTADEKQKFELYVEKVNKAHPRWFDAVCYFAELDPIFVIAPQEMFTVKPTFSDADPIVVQMTKKDEFSVQTFWNAPEALAVHLVDASNN